MRFSTPPRRLSDHSTPLTLCLVVSYGGTNETIDPVDSSKPAGETPNDEGGSVPSEPALPDGQADDAEPIIQRNNYIGLLQQVFEIYSGQAFDVRVFRIEPNLTNSANPPPPDQDGYVTCSCGNGGTARVLSIGGDWPYINKYQFSGCNMQGLLPQVLDGVWVQLLDRDSFD